MNALVAIDDLDLRGKWDDENSVPGSHAAFINAVILRAVSDLFSSSTDDASRSEALAFLTAKKGAWAENREHLCWLVDLDPDLLRERILDFLEGRRDLASFHRRGIGNLSAEHGRKFVAQERAREEAARVSAKERASQDQKRSLHEDYVLRKQRKAFEEQVKEAEMKVGTRPLHRRKVASTEYLEVDDLPLGHILRIGKTWEDSTFCTFLNVLLPDSSTAMGRAVMAACSEQGFVLGHHNRYHHKALKQAADLMGVAVLFQDADGNPVTFPSEAVTARLRLRPLQPDA